MKHLWERVILAIIHECVAQVSGGHCGALPREKFALSGERWHWWPSLSIVLFRQDYRYMCTSIISRMNRRQFFHLAQAVFCSQKWHVLDDQRDTINGSINCDLLVSILITHIEYRDLCANFATCDSEGTWSASYVENCMPINCAICASGGNCFIEACMPTVPLLAQNGTCFLHLW